MIAPSSMTLSPGTTVGPYQIVSQLGSGGMGVVYTATDPRLKRTVAIKLLPPDLTRDETAKQRFLQEAQAASALDHPNICTIHEINETDDGQLYLVMAHYEGETLKERIARGRSEVTPSHAASRRAPSPHARFRRRCTRPRATTRAVHRSTDRRSAWPCGSCGGRGRR